MLIDEKLLKHWIDNFYGYGSWQASFWFIAHEENGGEVPEEVADKLNYFHKVHNQDDGALCDIRELYKNVAIGRDDPKANSFNNLYEYRFGSSAVQDSVWKNLIAFAHGYRHEKLPDLLAYQQHTFIPVAIGTPAVQGEALIQLYPLPGPHSHAWYYSWLDLPQLGFLKSRRLYQEHVYQRRMQNILSNISMYKPKVVLMYGMENINALKKSIQEFFKDAKFKMIKATIPVIIGRQIPHHYRAEVNGTTILITTQIPALKHKRMETGFDWEEFGKKVKSES